MNIRSETNQSAPARKKAKLNEELVNLTTKKSCRIKELTSRLVELSNEYQELKDLDEFQRMVKKLGIEQIRFENEESCPLYQLPREVFNNCISFLDKSYVLVAPVSKCFQESYDVVFKGSKETATDFRGLPKEAGVYLIESVHENFSSLSILENDNFYKFIVGKEKDEGRRLGGLWTWKLSAEDYLIHKAAGQGNLDVFRHVVQNGNILRVQDQDFFLYQKIAENGHLHILQFLKEENFFFYGFCCSSYGAVRGGHIHILKWLKEIGCFNKPGNMCVIEKCAKIAAKCGQLEVLEYMREHIDSLMDFDLVADALQSKSVDVLRFCHAQRHDYFHGVTEDRIMETGEVEIVRYFFENQGEVSRRSTTLAAKNGYLDILKYLLSKNVTWNVNGVRRFEIMKFAYEKYRRWFDTTITNCIEQEKSNFNLDMLSYLREHDCPWGSHVTSALIGLKQEAFLKYIGGEEAVPDREDILTHAIQEKWFEGIRYILENNLECIVPPLNLVAVDFPCLDVLQYCKRKSLQWETQDGEMNCRRVLRRVAQESADIDTYKWIFNEIGAKQFHSEINLIAPNRTDLLEFLHEQKCVSDPKNLLCAISDGNLKYLEGLLVHYHDPLSIEENVFQEALSKIDSYLPDFDSHDRKDIVSLLIKSKCPQSLDVGYLKFASYYDR
ncbi:hypothetical protein CTEN210_12583 [Chaetoceros tenuissimus]|uniref:Uncharacterized protein n=1 Tax=Chaetoceros tenuissimus TaxID=426638 RepID=A0AAD3D1X6_9STRA|nr:hypothetical protein CTEN210_12583 [Chaetoceros tenuissimus]